MDPSNPFDPGSSEASDAAIGGELAFAAVIVIGLLALRVTCLPGGGYLAALAVPAIAGFAYGQVRRGSPLGRWQAAGWIALVHALAFGVIAGITLAVGERSGAIVAGAALVSAVVVGVAGAGLAFLGLEISAMLEED